MFNTLLISFIIGTYGDCIHQLEFNPETFEFTLVKSVEAKDASYLCDGGDFIYAVSESSVSGVYAFSGKLELINYSNSVGDGPCYIGKSAGSGKLITADYGGGTVSVLDTDRDGSITGLAQLIQFEGSGPVPERQAHARIHQVLETSRGKFLAADFGSDRIRVLSSSENGMINHNYVNDFRLPAGTGPRIVAENKKAGLLYCLTEISGEVYTLDAATGEIIQHLSIDPGSDAAGGDLEIHPNGKWLYASMRNGHDGIALFSIGSDGLLSRKDYTLTGAHPRHFHICNEGKLMLVACRDSRSIEVFRINQSDGRLENSGKQYLVESGLPVYIFEQN